jgi:DNA-binding response OmpR family regulator
VQIGAQVLPGHEATPLGQPDPESVQSTTRRVRGAAGPGAEGMLLAIVPIPGTGTSLAIVGYPVENGVRSQAVGTREADGHPEAGLLLDHDQRRVWTDGREVPLTYQEFELLAFLAAHPATVFSRADLVAKVWQRDFEATSRTVDVHVSRLRRKLGPRYGRYLVTEYRVGYRFSPEISEQPLKYQCRLPYLPL